MAKTTLSRTVFIGLGGTGADAIVRTKSLMLDSFGEVPPMIKFLVIDTDSITKVNYKNIAGETISLDDDEFIQFTVPNVKNYVNANPRTTSFFPKEMIERKASITEGAGQFRSCGRLSLIANDNNTFRTRLKNTFDTVKSWVGSMDDNYRVDALAPTRVFVIFSIAGGTGAGLFVDFSLLLKGDKNLAGGGDDIKTIAVALLPDVYSSLGQKAANCKPNAISGITEYELINEGKLNEIIPQQNHPAKFIETSGGKYPVDADNLYDTFFVVNNESTTGVKYETPKEMADIISKSMFLAAGATGGAANSALDNITAMTAGSKLRGRMLNYLGLGCAEMVFDSKQVATYYSLLQTNSICNNLLKASTEQKNIADEVQICFDEWRIQEDQNRDDVINFLVDKNPKQRFTGINEFDESSATAIKSRRESYIKGLKDALNKSIFDSQGTLDQITGRGLNNLQSFASEKINSQGGLYYLKEILPNMIGRFKGMMDEMTEERKEFETQLGRYENNYNTKLSEIEHAASISRFNVFKNRRSAIEAACDEFVNEVNTEAICIHEIERRTAAMAFYRKMIERAEVILNSIVSFEERLRKVVEGSSRQIQKVRSQNPKEPFTIHVTPEYVRAMKFDQGDVDMGVFSEKMKVSDLALHGQSDANELFNKFFGYTSSLAQTQAYLKTTLLDILQRMPIERVKELFLMLKSSIGILRRTDPNYPIDNARNYVIGVFDIMHPAILDRSKSTEESNQVNIKSKNEILDLELDGEVGKAGHKAKKIQPNPGDILRSEFKFDGKVPELSNTRDPNKIIISAYESAVPAFIVRNFEGYAFDMDHKSDSINEELRYSNKYWGDIIMKRRYSIFPQNEDNIIKTWALAFFVSKVEKEKHGKSAVQFVAKPKKGKYAVYTTSGDKAMKDLHAQRTKAFEMFKEQKHLADEILPMLQQKIKNDLSTYRLKLDELKNDQQGNIYIDEYSSHNLGKTTYNSEAHQDTRTLVMDEFRFLQNTADIADLIS